MSNNNNPLVTEISLVVVAALLVIGGVVLLLLSKIDVAFASSMFILAAGLLGFNGALKAPSPAQQAQLQQLTSQALSALPAVVAATQQPVPPQGGSVIAPTAAQQPVQPQFVPDPATSLAAYQTGMMQAVVPPQAK
jgi:hypothetical protein